MSNEESVNIKRLEEGDLNSFVDLVKLFEEVFEMENFSIPDTKHLQRLFNQNNFDVFVAFKDNKVVGGLTIYILEQYYSEKALAYIYDLAVAAKYQRQGIGKKLIEEVKILYKMNGFEDMFVQAEKVDKQAIEFYRKTNPSEEEKVVYFSYSLNK
ncbi:GNAT family N-acetyltransferase [Aquimarina sp. RZ0]|uniref:GNAT family N-acetyltransferase n=1 Tax=Aquimarina sp. RZ0 TaxID=2607730 RepID=UPI0011F3A6E6|nr:GNAT family N-acetyltransferase [Aquimarina sp. RZ0]KAA1243273.1 GNAT family N-acetyltransferase [Aquimarina sp. RZ0]